MSKKKEEKEQMNLLPSDEINFIDGEDEDDAMEVNNRGKRVASVGIAFNAVKYDSFAEVVEAIGQYGPGMKPPSYHEDGAKMFDFLNKFVNRIGIANVVQVVTDSESNNKYAGRMLEKEHPHLYWTPCAAHCLDLMLEDIGKLPSIFRTMQRAVELNSYIYMRPKLLNIMRNFTHKKELLRPAKTRFATCFITLSSIHKQKNNLRKMFTSEEWNRSKWAKEEAGKRVASYVLMPSFWNNIVFSLKVSGPLIPVLRLADGYYLNPEYFYSNQKIEEDEEIAKGLYACIARLVLDDKDQDKITEELSLYSKAERLFGNRFAIRQRSTRAPANWWEAYGKSTKLLQKFAIKLHNKKRNRLAQTTLNDLVFIKYNRALRHRYNMRDTLDPILLDDINESNEWLTGRMDDSDAEYDLVYEDDSLTWGDVANFTGIGEASRPQRSTRSKSSSSSRLPTKGVRSSSVQLVDEDEDDSDEIEEDPKNYESFSDDQNDVMLINDKDDI
ncbi:uncharacterized protein LOC132269733 [Cornus florida]|uniref:uncharacterized protein LOC132269733 n=1 Tax=Cornus florida TaxID=4283 RepID=UPI00289DA767|nr:uncharacterized protein LOC132269733 [Cornus florida]